MVHNHVFALHANLETAVKKVVEEIALDYKIHLNSKYAKDCPITVVSEGNFDGMPSVDLTIERTDNKKVQSHLFTLSFVSDEDGNEGAILESKFYGSNEKNKVTLNIPHDNSVMELALNLNAEEDENFNRESQSEFFYNLLQNENVEESEVY